MDPQGAAGRACGFAEVADRSEAGRRRDGGRWEISPHRAEPVDEASFQIDRDKWDGFEVVELRDQPTNLLSGGDVPSKENQSGRSNRLENRELGFSELGTWNPDDQGQRLSRRR